MPAHALAPEAVLNQLEVLPALGLTEQAVNVRAQSYGSNAIPAGRSTSAMTVLLHQFTGPVVYLLGAAAALAMFFREWEEAAAIGVVLLLNGAIGFVTEIKAARSIEALRALGTHFARVRRDGQVRQVAVDTLVIGDILLVDAEEAVAADVRLIEASSLAADESTLTGESLPVDKALKPVPATTRLADRKSMLFRGTLVTHGSGVGVVVATGSKTELGQISRLIEGVETEQSPLEVKLAQLSGQLTIAVLVVTTLIAGMGLATGRNGFDMVEAAIALAVAAIPEGLPIVATLALARGMWRMARKNALIERLSAVETLGATTIILTDKTGTLTENRMSVRRLWLPSREVELDIPEPNSAGSSDGSDDPQLHTLAEIAVLCNDATLGTKAGEESGDPMEIALLRLGRRAGLPFDRLVSGRTLVRKYAFDTETRMMATIHRVGDQYLYAVKGAPEEVLERSRRSHDGDSLLNDAAAAEWAQRIEDLGSRGLRVLALASKRVSTPDEAPFAKLTFAGLVGLEDPARADVPSAIAACKTAGIRVVMVTGDHVVTARSVGKSVGLGTDSTLRVTEGADFKALDAKEAAALLDTDIFARVNPAEKLELVRRFQSAGEIVAMTGDGVNDGPALRQADIGVAMGLRGTDVARESADMVLLDDAFPTIVEAIREGRAIFSNIRRLVAYLLSCNLSEIIVIGAAIPLSLPLPILPLQILYLNLVTDVFPAVALAMGEGDADGMTRPPRDPRRPILDRSQWLLIAFHSGVLAAATFGSLVLGQFWLNLDGEAVVTVAFLTLAFSQLWHVFNAREPNSNLLRNDITRNSWVWGSLLLCTALLVLPLYIPALARVLQLTAPSPLMWTVILTMSFLPLVVGQLTTEAARYLTSPRVR